MKKVRFALAGVALVTAVLTMSFTSLNIGGNDSAQENDCWSTIARHQSGQSPDRSTILCPTNVAGCCVTPNPNNPGTYLEFAEN